MIIHSKSLIHLFRIAINPPDEFYNVIENFIQIEGGTEVLIRVEPIELYSDSSVSSIGAEQRKCRMATEVPDEMNLFQNYTRNACLYNCMYEYR